MTKIACWTHLRWIRFHFSTPNSRPNSRPASHKFDCRRFFFFRRSCLSDKVIGNPPALTTPRLVLAHLPQPRFQRPVYKYFIRSWKELTRKERKKNLMIFLKIPTSQLFIQANASWLSLSLTRTLSTFSVYEVVRLCGQISRHLDWFLIFLLQK